MAFPPIVLNPVSIADKQANLNGLLVGCGTAFDWVPPGPTWWDAPTVRSSDQPRSGTDGMTPGRDLEGMQAITLQVWILGDTATDLGNKIDAWKAACAVVHDGVVSIKANMLGRTRIKYGRFRVPGDATLPEGFVFPLGKGAAQFVNLDPKTYSDPEQSVSTTRSIEGSGFTPPFTPPFTLGAGTVGAVALTQAGNTAAPWRARLDADLSQPVITHLESGRFLDLRANGGIDLSGGGWVDIDSATRSVLLNGIADRRTMLSTDSLWWNLQQGTNTFRLDAASGTGALTVYWRDAYRS